LGRAIWPTTWHASSAPQSDVLQAALTKCSCAACHAAGTLSLNWNCIIVGIAAGVYALSLVLAIASVAQRIFWHLAGGWTELCLVMGLPVQA